MGTTNFYHQKRIYLLNKLDEVIKLWASGSGQGQRGPARQERDRQRAAKHQAAKAAAAVPVPAFPGTGRAVGSAARPILPIPLRKGDVFPSPEIQVTPASPPSLPAVVTTALSTSSSPVAPTVPHNSITTSSTNLPTMTLVNSSLLSPAMAVRDEILSESDDEKLTPVTRQMLAACGLCHQPFTSSSGPGYCPQCQKCYHIDCGREHYSQCLAFSFPPP